MWGLIKLILLSYACWWAWNKVVNKRSVGLADLKALLLSFNSTGPTEPRGAERLQVEVLETTMGEVDADGDVQCAVRVKIKNTTEHDLSRISLTTVVKTDSGVILCESHDESYDEIKAGGSFVVPVDLGYLKFDNVLWGVNTSVAAVGYGASPASRQEVELPQAFEGPILLTERINVAPGITLQSLSCVVTKSDKDEETSSGAISLRGTVASKAGGSTLGLDIKCAVKSSGGRALGEDSSSVDSIAVSGQPVCWSIDVDNVARLSRAKVEISCSTLVMFASGEGVKQGYEDAVAETEADDLDEEDVYSASEDLDSDGDFQEEDAHENDEISDEEDSSDDDDSDSEGEADDDDQVAIITLQIQSLQSFAFANRADSPKPTSLDQIKADFEHVELSFYPPLPCQCSVGRLTVKDVQVIGDRVERRYEGMIHIFATDDEYEKVKLLLTDEGFFKDGVADWSAAIASFIWDTNRAPDYADFCGEQRTITVSALWHLDVDGEEKRPQIESEIPSRGDKIGGSSHSRGRAHRSDGDAKAIDIIAYVRSVQAFSFNEEVGGALPNRSRIERDFREVSCSLDAIPPEVCKVTDVKVDDVAVSKNGVTRAFTCVVHVSATGEQLRALHKLMVEEDYVEGGDINWSGAIGAFLADCYECPDYACFSNERVSVDTTEVESGGAEVQSHSYGE